MVDYVRIVRPYLADTLIPSTRLASLEGVAGILPPCPLAGFECRLGTGDRRVDLQVQLPRHALPDELPAAGDDGWAFVRQLHDEWLAADSGVARSVTALGLEFDVEAQVHGGRVQVPALFVALDQATVVDANRLMSMAHRMLNRAPSPTLAARLSTCIDALPAGAAIRFLGTMLSRPSGALRINVCDLPASHIAEYLRAVGWECPVRPLTSLLSTLNGHADTLVLCLDLADDILPRIGIECVLDGQPSEEPRWGALLDQLVQHGLATPADRQALLQWPGYTRKPTETEYWPESLSLGDRMLGADAVSVFHRYLSHVKVLYDPRGRLSAKAYLGFRHQWIDVTAHSAGSPTPTYYRITDAAPSEHLRTVREYWEETTHLYLQHWTTFQAGLIIPSERTNVSQPEGGQTDADQTERSRASNLYFAARAGVRPGDRVLDAGCGVCGPSIDIAQGIDRVRIDGVTLSPVQGRVATSAIHEAALDDRITVHVADYHHLPFEAATFDVVVFFESLLYSPDLAGLFAEVYRVLRSGGCMYAKELFREERSLSTLDQRALEEFEQLYRYPTRSLTEAAARAMAAGFDDIETGDLSSRLTIDHYERAAVDVRSGMRLLTPFGRRHHRQFGAVPVHFGELRARKPDLLRSRQLE
jgi:SAM-dependent methyltransferase